jgi:hypothetical protein
VACQLLGKSRQNDVRALSNLAGGMPVVTLIDGKQIWWKVCELDLTVVSGESVAVGLGRNYYI